MNDDYIILFDENGQPYIQHAFGDNARAAWGKLKGTATKYLEKVPDYYGKGKALYLYTKEQVDAFHNRGKAKVRDALGYDERERRDAARNANRSTGSYQGAIAKTQADYDKTVLGKLENVGKALKSARDTINQYGKTTLGSIRKAGEAASQAGRNALDSTRNLVNRAGEAASQAGRNALDSAQNLANRAGQATGEAARAVARGAQNTSETIKDAASKAVEGLSDAVDDAAFELSWFADDVIDRYNDLTGKTARERRDKAYDDYLRATRIYGFMAASGDEYARNEIQQALDLFNAAQMVYQHR